MDALSKPKTLMGLEFDARISISHLITIGLLLLSMAGAYVQLATKGEVKQAVESVNTAVDGVKREYVTRELLGLQVQLLSTQVVTLSTKIEELKGDIKDIKRAVR